MIMIRMMIMMRMLMMMDAFRHTMDASLRHKHPEADPKQKCDGNHREANADHMCKYVRQFQFRRN